jgi:diguanylate cyclase (GGDEF)-like protein
MDKITQTEHGCIERIKHTPFKKATMLIVGGAMTLRSLVLLAAISYTLIIGGSLFGYRLFIVYPALIESTIEQHQNDIEAVFAAYETEKVNLLRFTSDWAKWDEAYQFTKTKNRSFIKRNFTGSFINSGIDAVALLGKRGELLYAGINTGNAFNEVKSLDELSPDLELEQLIEQDESFGFIRVNNQLGYFASSHIQDTDQEHSINGTLIFIQILKTDFFERTSHISKASFTHYDINEIDLMGLVSEPLINHSEINKNTLSEKYYIWVSNSIKKPFGLIEVKYPKNSIPKHFDELTIYSIGSLLLLPIFITIIIWVVFLAPISKMIKQIKLMSESGDMSNLDINSYISEFETFQDIFNDLVSHNKEYQDKLESESQTDGLTQIFNRRHFDEYYDQTWRASTRNSVPIAIIMMDIDHFKRYNDHYGHQKGDDTLIAVAKALQSHTRRAMDFLARYGGEEFVMVCQVDSNTQLEQLLAEILKSITDLNIEHVDSSVSNVLTISCGACIINEPGAWMQKHKDLALKMADQALYKAKNSGRNRYHVSQLTQPHV